MSPIRASSSFCQDSGIVFRKRTLVNKSMSIIINLPNLKSFDRSIYMERARPLQKENTAATVIQGSKFSGISVRGHFTDPRMAIDPKSKQGIYAPKASLPHKIL